MPGLVVAVLNNAKARDRSHYESFPTWHETLYRDVEPTSVTPFASRARDRALHAVLVALVRHLAPGMLDRPTLNDDALEAARGLISDIVQRSTAIDPQEAAVKLELERCLDTWEFRAPRSYWTRQVRSSLLQDRGTGRNASGDGTYARRSLADNEQYAQRRGVHAFQACRMAEGTNLRGE